MYVHPNNPYQKVGVIFIYIRIDVIAKKHKIA